ncbi:cytidine deaminase-like protein [Cokeromyces recurvatus]|uniref:cytidine deaminase-like protein n=1 Tax=Cokeromyces recurvatus TaxID=90255 RepID=UPI002220C0CB|nr:cytidine deaminase-like protein [Cokeromyces recurvatus]KAI7898329.1 cytidine deaminase-like protein [Cokeromyces recurvatus]
MKDAFGTPYTNDANDLKYMQLAIEEANKSIPAPQAYCVGAVLVSGEGKVLSTGYSREIMGNTHAEECALAKLDTNSMDLTHATLYTTMEPCSIRLSGNRSCTSRIIEAKLKRVVLGVREPPNLVNCEGIQLLEKEGIQVLIVPNVEEACLAPNQHILSKKK